MKKRRSLFQKKRRPIVPVKPKAPLVRDLPDDEEDDELLPTEHYADHHDEMLGGNIGQLVDEDD